MEVCFCAKRSSLSILGSNERFTASDWESLSKSIEFSRTHWSELDMQCSITKSAISKLCSISIGWPISISGHVHKQRSRLFKSIAYDQIIHRNEILQRIWERKVRDGCQHVSSDHSADDPPTHLAECFGILNETCQPFQILGVFLCPRGCRQSEEPIGQRLGHRIHQSEGTFAMSIRRLSKAATSGLETCGPLQTDWSHLRAQLDWMKKTVAL